MKKLESILWAEKYRPKNLKEMVLDEVKVGKFSEYIKKKEIPHLLFYGSTGSGKTTTSLILIKKLKADHIILNASSTDRGINTIKGKVKEFARSKSTNNRLKIVFLDEADGLTPDAQPALRNTIETYSNLTRFILTANNISKIIPALQSRCTLLHFKKQSKQDILKYIRKILDSEGIIYKRYDVMKVIENHYPDIRVMVNELQLNCMDVTLRLNKKAYKEFDYEKLNKAILKGNLPVIRNMCSDVDFTMIYKWLFNTFIPSIYSIHLKNNEMNDIATTIAYSLYTDSQVLDREINFVGCILEIMKILKVDVKWK